MITIRRAVLLGAVVLLPLLLIPDSTRAEEWGGGDAEL